MPTMAHTKAKGTTKLGRDSRPKYLGIKLSGGQSAQPGAIIVRQRGLEFKAGEGARMGKDYTIYSVKDGVVHFSTIKKMRFNGRRRTLKIISVS